MLFIVFTATTLLNTNAGKWVLAPKKKEKASSPYFELNKFLFLPLLHSLFYVANWMYKIVEKSLSPIL